MELVACFGVKNEDSLCITIAIYAYLSKISFFNYMFIYYLLSKRSTVTQMAIHVDRYLDDSKYISGTCRISWSLNKKSG